VTLFGASVVAPGVSPQSLHSRLASSLLFKVKDRFEHCFSVPLARTKTGTSSSRPCPPSNGPGLTADGPPPAEAI
jgi:hypothetical protein